MLQNQKIGKAQSVAQSYNSQKNNAKISYKDNKKSTKFSQF